MLGLLEKEEYKLSDKEFIFISDVVYEHCGINLHDGKKELVRARLSKRIRTLKMNSFAEYLDFALADRNGDEFYEMIDSLSTNLTSFFRENKHFDFLNTKFLPNLYETKTKIGSTKLRCWSAGCSTGEEPYTIAITLLDFFENKKSWDIKILATDVSTRVLKKAQNGFYESQRVEPLTGMQKQKYLTKCKNSDKGDYAVKDNLKKIITFRYLNLMEPFPFNGPIDFIFCRNVMIYFDKPTQENLISRYHNVLAPGGILFTGHSESLTGIKHNFKYIQPTIYQK